MIDFYRVLSFHLQGTEWKGKWFYFHPRRPVWDFLSDSDPTSLAVKHANLCYAGRYVGMALRINRVTDLSHVISLLVVMVSIGQVYTLNNDNDSTWNNNFDDGGKFLNIMNDAVFNIWFIYLGLTCWTCPNKTDNEICNDWAPDKECAPSEYNMCTCALIATDAVKYVHGQRCQISSTAICDAWLHK